MLHVHKNIIRQRTPELMMEHPFHTGLLATRPKTGYSYSNMKTTTERKSYYVKRKNDPLGRYRRNCSI